MDHIGYPLSLHSHFYHRVQLLQMPTTHCLKNPTAVLHIMRYLPLLPSLMSSIQKALWSYQQVIHQTIPLTAHFHQDILKFPQLPFCPVLRFPLSAKLPILKKTLRLRGIHLSSPIQVYRYNYQEQLMDSL